MVDQPKGAFFDQKQVDNWDARETGQALRAVLGKIGKMSRTGGNDDQIRNELTNDPDALAGLEHIKSVLREPSRS